MIVSTVPSSDTPPPGMSIDLATQPGGPRWSPGTDGALFITGQCGAGKTELLRHIARSAQSSGCEVTVVEPTSRGGRRSRWPAGTRVVRGAAAGHVLAEILETPTATDQVLMIDGAVEVEHQMRHGIGGHSTVAPQDLLTRACAANTPRTHVAVTSLETTPPWSRETGSVVALGRCPRPAGWPSVLGDDDIPEVDPQPGQGWLIRRDRDPAWLDLTTTPAPQPRRTIQR